MMTDRANKTNSQRLAEVARLMGVTLPAGHAVTWDDAGNVPAYSSVELGEILPIQITDEPYYLHFCKAFPGKDGRHAWQVQYRNHKDGRLLVYPRFFGEKIMNPSNVVSAAMSFTEADARCLMLIQLIEEKLFVKGDDR